MLNSIRRFSPAIRQTGNRISQSTQRTFSATPKQEHSKTKEVIGTIGSGLYFAGAIVGAYKTTISDVPPTMTPCDGIGIAPNLFREPSQKG